MAGETRAFKCPHCAGSVQVRAAGRSLCVVCVHCSSVIDPNDPQHKILSKATMAQVVKPIIPLGTRGKFKETTYEVVGFMVRSDGTGNYIWEEYLLYNPRQGFCWLVQNSGSWSFVRMSKSKPVSGNYSFDFDNRSYRIFLSDRSKIVYIYGEFYWQARRGDVSATADYVSPPFMLSSESSGGPKGDNESVWSVGEYMTSDDVQNAFGSIRLEMPAKIGIAPHEPNPFEAELSGYVGFGALAILICAFLGTSSFAGTGNNVFTGVLLIAAVPAWRIFRRSSFERERWSTSDFAPVSHDDED